MVEETTFDKIILPATIYKYRNWNKDDHKRILTHNEISFSSPLDMDEQHECSLERDFSLLTDEMIYKFCYNTARPSQYRTDEERRALATRMIKDSPIRDAGHQKEMQELFRKELDMRLSIFSASKHRNIATLWDTFAANQRGFCIGFNTRKMFSNEEIFGGGGPVVYYPSAEPPKIRPITFSLEEKVEDMMTVIMSLPEKFERECEFRLVKMHMPSQQVHINTDAYEEIILGDKMPAEHKEEILKIARTQFPAAQILQAKCDYEIGDYLFEVVK